MWVYVLKRRVPTLYHIYLERTTLKVTEEKLSFTGRNRKDI